MSLANKHILLLSPQPWGVARVSKHHYAIEMAKRGNRVSFVAVLPADPSHRGHLELTRLSEPRGLEVLTYRQPVPSWLKFKLPRLFNWAMRRQARRILKALRVGQVDVVWDFVSSALFADLRVFPAKCYVFHPVDAVTSNDAKGADVIFSLTDMILGKLKHCAVPMHFVNHGLSDAFVANARRILEDLAAADHASTGVSGGPIQIGYAGNLLMPCIDRANYRAVIERNPGLIFHFWGPYSNATNNLGPGLTAALEFVDFLRGCSNVRLHGVVPPEQLAGDMSGMDALAVCYDGIADPNGAANSHKLLEYLSTGKTVISTHIRMYVRYPGMLEMLPTLDNSRFVEHFDAAVSRLSETNGQARQRQRIEFALEHTYSRQLDRIEQVLSELELLD